MTRAMVLEAAAGLRAVDPSASAEQKLDRLVREIIASAVSTGDDLVDYTAYPTSDGAEVTGVLIDVSLTRTDSIATRSLATVAVAPSSDGVELDGSVIVTGLPVDATGGARTLHSAQLSGDVHVTAAVDASDSGVLRVALTTAVVPDPAPSTPPSTPSPSTPTPSTPSPAEPPPRTSTPRTAAELLAARRTYDAALRSARVKYAKARKKAGRSKRRRIAAKRAYDTRRARAKVAYRAAIADVPAPAAPPAVSPSTAAASAATASAVPAGGTIISTDTGWGPAA